MGNNIKKEYIVHIYICTFLSESLCHTLEINTTLEINYTYLNYLFIFGYAGSSFLCTGFL